MKIRNFLIGVLLTAGASKGAQFLWLSGSEFDRMGQSYYFSTVTIQKNLKGKYGVLGRIWIDHLTYRFNSEGQRITARAPGFSVGAGAGYSGRSFRISLIGGYENRRTEVDPDVPGIKVKGQRDGFIAVGEVFVSPARRIHLQFISSYSTSTSYLWAMASAWAELLFKGFNAGFEVIGQGNPDYRAYQGGVRTGLRRGPFSSIIRAGYKDSSSGRGAYGGLEFMVSF